MGRFGGCDWRKKRPLARPGGTMTASPKKQQRILWCHWLGSGPVVPCKAGTPAQIRRAGPGSWEGGAGGRPLTLTHSCLPALSCLCSILLSVFHDTLCLQVPQAEEAPMGRDWSRRMSAREDSQLCPFPLTPSPLPRGPLDTNPHSLHLLRFRVPKPTQPPYPFRPSSLVLVTSCKEIVLEVQGREHNIPLCGRAPWPKFHHHCFQETSRGHSFQESGAGEGTSLQPGTGTQSRDCSPTCMLDGDGVADCWRRGLEALSFKEDTLRPQAGAQSGEQRAYLRVGGSRETSWRRGHWGWGCEG